MIDPRIERMVEETRQQASLTPVSTAICARRLNHPHSFLI